VHTDTALVSKKVNLSENVETFFIPYEDRKGQWMKYAIDRAHFKRRIDHLGTIIEPILRKQMYPQTTKIRSGISNVTPKAVNTTRSQQHTRVRHWTFHNAASPTVAQGQRSAATTNHKGEKPS
jgi:hypothetical protein